MKKTAFVLIGLLLLGCLHLPASQSKPRYEAACGLGLGCGFFRIGTKRQTHEWALRYLFTSDVFSEHLDDNKEIGALVYVTVPPESRSIFFRMGIGAALCFVETANAKAKPAIGLPLDAQLAFFIGRHFSMGLYIGQTITTLKKYGVGGITFSIYI